MEIKALVIDSAKKRYFYSLGADIKEIEQLEDEIKKFMIL